MKKLLSVILTICLLLTVMPFGIFNLTASAEDTKHISGYYAYTISNGEATLTRCNSVISGDVSIPSTLGGYPVTSIGDSAFSDCNNLTSVTIPDSVTRIGYRAFFDCDSLTSITIPDSVTSIGDEAFLGCDSITDVYITDITAWCNIDFEYYYSNPLLYAEKFYINGVLQTDIVIPDGVTSIGKYAFAYCDSLTSVIIGDTVTNIGVYAFENCDSLTSIKIGDSLTNIGVDAFSYCNALINIFVNENNTAYCLKDGVLFDKSKTELIYYPAGKSESSYTIPDGVASIGRSAFACCDSLTSITIPDSVTSIGWHAFHNTGYYNDSANWENNVLYIGNHLIEAKTSISGSYTIKSGTKTIADGAFQLCKSMTSVIIPDTVISIGEFAFSYCSKLMVIITPKSFTSIGNYAFRYCYSLASIEIPSSVTSIGKYAFYNCSALQDVYYGGSKYGWANISILSGNNDLLNATIHYAKPNPKASAPENLTATLYGYDDVALSWNAVEGAAGYAVYYKKSSASSYTKKGNTTATSCKFANLADSTNYDFKVVAYLDATDQDTYSDEIVVRFKTSCPVGKASTLTGSLYGHDDVELNWKAVAGATGYKVYYKKASAKNYTLKATTPALTYSIANLTDNCKYNFKIVPVATYGSTTTTGTAKVITYSTTKDLAAPKTLKASLYGYDDAKLTWNAVAGASRYKIYYKQSSADTYKYKTYTTKTTYNFANLYDGVSYDFKIVPCSYVNGTHFEAANFKTVTISSTINISAPTTFKAELYGYDDVQLDWSEVENAVAYKVYYKKSTAKSYTLKATTTELTTKIWNLSDGIKYDFKVVPCTYVNGGYFEDDSSKTASLYTLKKISTPTVTKHKAGKVKITWGNIQGESGYEISRSLSKTGTYIVSDFATTSGKARIVSATKGKTYYYKVRVYKIVNGEKIYSPWSSVKAYKLK